MNRLVAALVIGIVAAGAALGQEPVAEPVAQEEKEAVEAGEEFAGEVEKASYALGFNFGSTLVKMGVEVTVDELLAGLRDAVTGQEGRLTENEVVVLTQQIQNAAGRRLAAERQALIAENRAAGEAFMAQNKDRPGIISLPSGLQYEILQEGDGPTPLVDDTVTVHYSTTTLDGTVVDSSYERGAPPTLRPDRVVPAWTEALPMMAVGSIWRLFTPTDLGYGDKQSSSNIPAGSTLIFDVELLSIEPRTEAAAEDDGTAQE